MTPARLPPLIRRTRSRLRAWLVSPSRRCRHSSALDRRRRGTYRPSSNRAPEPPRGMRWARRGNQGARRDRGKPPSPDRPHLRRARRCRHHSVFTGTAPSAQELTAKMTPAERAADRTWTTLRLAKQLRARFGEEALTDLLVLDMLPHQRARGFWLRPTTKPAEHRWGADLFVAVRHGTGRWSRLALQAKKLDPTHDCYRMLNGGGRASVNWTSSNVSRGSYTPFPSTCSTTTRSPRRLTSTGTAGSSSTKVNWVARLSRAGTSGT